MRNAGSSKPNSRGGIVTAMVIVVLILVSGLILSFVQRSVTDRRQTRRELEYQQTVQLAAAGIKRAEVLRRADSNYAGEIWEIPAGQIHQTNTASVTIRIDGLQASVVARYPSQRAVPFQVTQEVALTP